ncbi:MAG: response regulator transcription factor [Acidimicrobiales bacterium]|nr:response regulator transcription factor [Acidimicrobiales bacterium]
MRILLVEDDELLAASLGRSLRAEGYAVDIAGDGLLGLYLAGENDYDAVILDVLLPGMNGYRLCSGLRARGQQVPVLMLTAKGGVYDQEEGLDTGADDYLVKPVRYPVLLAHLRALLRRGPARLPPVLVHGRVVMDPGRHRCLSGDDEVDLTPREFALLRYLLSYPGVTHTSRELLDHVWGEHDSGDINVVQVYVRALRRKLDPPGRESVIETIRGVGYRLADVN